ncbi:hypothetical protein SESBI_26017 [Sesbania bispinosa]|nr:hypothetical protein SESBI_26017 [Sesbania bispinosa]
MALVYDLIKNIFLGRKGCIPRFGFTFTDSAGLLDTDEQSDFLIDTIGLLTVVSSEKRSIRDGRMTRVIQLELTDDKDYVDIINEQLNATGAELPVVIIQLAKVKRFRGEIMLQNVLTTTRILFNPETSEVEEFKNGVVRHGIDLFAPMRTIEENIAQIHPYEELMRRYPRKTISELHNTYEDGIFIVLASVVNILGNGQWWYEACKCNRVVTMEGDMYYCPSCDMLAKEAMYRYKINLEVFYGDETTSLIMFDFDSQQLLGIPCADLVAKMKVENGLDSVPDKFDALSGKEMLFMIEKLADYSYRLDETYKVKRVCEDEDIIAAFKNEVDIATPNNVRHTASQSRDQVVAPRDQSVLTETQLSTVASEGDPRM